MPSESANEIIKYSVRSAMSRPRTPSQPTAKSSANPSASKPMPKGASERLRRSAVCICFNCILQIELAQFAIYNYSGPLKFIPHAPNRLQKYRVGRVGLNLLPQPADMHGDGAHVAGEGVTPHIVEQLLAGEYLAGIAHQKLQQIELAHRQIDRLPIGRRR